MPGPHRRVALGRAHELQGHDQHSARRDEGDRRAVRRDVERLHLDRPDDLPRDGRPRCARPDALHRSRADDERPLRASRHRVRADGDHLRAAGRGERSRAAPRHRGHRHRVPFTSLPASDDRLARRPAVHEPGRPVSATTGEHYIPNNATLVVVGDVEVDEVLRRVERRFGAHSRCGERRRERRMVGAASDRRAAGRSSSGRGRPPT